MSEFYSLLVGEEVSVDEVVSLSHGRGLGALLLGLFDLVQQDPEVVFVLPVPQRHLWGQRASLSTRVCVRYLTSTVYSCGV